MLTKFAYFSTIVQSTGPLSYVLMGIKQGTSTIEA